MSSIPPANMNLVAGITQTASSQRRQAVEKDSKDRQQAHLVREQTFLDDLQDHQVEDTLQTEDTRIRRQNEEESHQQKKHRHRQMPEDNLDTNSEGPDDSDHIDLQA